MEKQISVDNQEEIKRKVRVGDRYGRLLVVSPATNPRFEARRWNCLCDCGNELKLKSSDLTSKGGYRSCGCYWDDKLIGTKVNSLYIESKSGAYYNCICDCGRKCKVNCTYVRNGTRKDCKCSNKDMPGSGKKHTDPITSIYASLISTCNSSARSRGLEYSLSHDEYREVVSMPCLYCGHAGDKRYSSRKGHADLFVVANGVDRINNNAGYIPGNCVACCWRCNIMKGAQTAGQFIEHCKRVCDSSYELLDFMD